MATFVPPMLATPGDDAALPGDGWSHEFKWDGVRAIVVVEDGTTTLWSRNGNDVTAAYPELDLAGRVPDGSVLDGEVVALDDDGVPSFALLQHRMHVRDAGRAAQAAGRRPVTLMLFDVLRTAGTDVVDQPLHARRDALDALTIDHPRTAVPPRGGDAASMLAIADERGLEGIVSKRLDSPYQPGVRSRDWLKLRIVHEQDCAVVGWRRGRAGRSGRLGALLLATWEGDRFVHAGAVGSGLRDADVDTWQRHLEGLTRADAVAAGAPTGDDHVWSEPAAVVRVRHRGWTPEGRLRQPSYVGVRTDVDVTATSRDA